MDARQRFYKALRRTLFPLLRSQGFVGKGTTFRRLNGEVIQVLNIQGSIYGGQCCVNLAIHLTFLPAAGGDQVDPESIVESQCEFRTRLAPAGLSDYWWEYGKTEVQAEASVSHMVELYQSRGAPYFERHRSFPGPFGSITPQQLEADDFGDFPIPIGGPVQAAVTMVRIAQYLGRKDQAKEFARIALSRWERGTALRAELEQILNAP